MNDLTVVEQIELEQLEVTISNGLQTFVEVGGALMRIRDERLYRLSHATFEDYCQQRWGMNRGHANRLIAAASVVGSLDPIGSISSMPTSESQVRPLTVLQPDQRREAWQQAVDTAPNGKVTAAHVEAVVQQYRPTVQANEPVVIPPLPEFLLEIKTYPLPAANHAVSFDPDYDGDEWYTPVEYIQAARRVMGEIDLDPASCHEAQEIIKARHYYTKHDNSLLDDYLWVGRVWLNPPYSMPSIKQFVTKLIDQYEVGSVSQAIILTNNSSDTSWFHELLSRYPACFTRGRVQFWRADHTTFGARQGQTLFYLGSDMTRFADEFGQFGQVVIRL